MFINFTNHPSAAWSDAQLCAAQAYGEITDIPFPMVDPFADTQAVHELADKFAAQIIELAPDCVLCQGEFSLAFAVVERLKRQGLKVVVACSNRRVSEELVDGVTRKIVEFVFCGFREY